MAGITIDQIAASYRAAIKRAKAPYQGVLGAPKQQPVKENVPRTLQPPRLPFEAYTYIPRRPRY